MAMPLSRGLTASEAVVPFARVASVAHVPDGSSRTDKRRKLICGCPYCSSYCRRKGSGADRCCRLDETRQVSEV
jgi:hypothetical protein